MSISQQEGCLEQHGRLDPGSNGTYLAGGDDVG
jgi:hypothetical protein